MGCCVRSQRHGKDPNATGEISARATFPQFEPMRKDIHQLYKFKRVIGHGHYGTVRIAKSLANPSEKYAVKTIVKKKLKGEVNTLQREIEILSRLDHPNIIKLYAVFEDDKQFHLVTEYCDGGDLFDRIATRGHYSEAEAAKLMGKILLAVNTLHANGICHRDLKPENFLFESRNPAAELKLIDFGLSNKFFDKFVGTEMHSFVGTPNYVAPEVLRGGYGAKCDIWSAGVILYMLLSGELPFAGENTNQVFAKILKGSVSFKGDVWKQVSKDAKDLVSHMLVIDQKQRYTAEAALAHPWFSSSPTHKLSIDPKILSSLQRFKFRSKFQSEVFAVIVKHLNISQIQSLKEAFLALDTEKNGSLSYQEIEVGLRNAGFNPASEEIAVIMRNADWNGDGLINYSEFIAATMDFKAVLDEESLWAAFNLFDVSGTGFITQQDLKEALATAGRRLSDSEIEAIFREAGTGPQGVSFTDFKQIISQSEQ